MVLIMRNIKEYPLTNDIDINFCISTENSQPKLLYK